MLQYSNMETLAPINNEVRAAFMVITSHTGM